MAHFGRALVIERKAPTAQSDLVGGSRSRNGEASMRVVENLKRAGPWVGFLVVALVLLALITAGWEQWRITLPLFVTGLLIGWIVGILMSPVSPHETEQFSEYGKAISTFIAGFLVAKLALEHVARAMRLSPLDPLMFSMQ